MATELRDVPFFQNISNIYVLKSIKSIGGLPLIAKIYDDVV